MEPIVAYKPLGLICLALIIAGLLFLVRHWPGGTHMTFSQHAAQHQSAIFYYIGFFSVLLPLLYLFFAKWFSPAFGLPASFMYAITAALVLQYSVALIPEITGWKKTYHVTGSGLSGLAMLAAIYILFFTGNMHSLSRAVTLASALLMSGLIIFGALHKITHHRLLWLQASFYAAFFVAIFGVTYFD